MELPSAEMGNAMGATGFGVKIEFSFGHAELDVY